MMVAGVAGWMVAQHHLLETDGVPA